MGFRIGGGGSDNMAETPAFCGIPAGAELGEKNVPTGENGGGTGTVVEHSLCYVSKT